MSSKAIVVKPDDRATALDVIGTKVTILLSRADARDLQITFQCGEEGTGPPPHNHVWDESFYVTKGQIAFTTDGQTTMCSAGTLVHVPAGIIHAFSYGPGGGEMLEITGKGSSIGDAFIAIDRTIPPGPPDIPKVIQVLGEHGVDVHL